MNEKKQFLHKEYKVFDGNGLTSRYAVLCLCRLGWLCTLNPIKKLYTNINKCSTYHRPTLFDGWVASLLKHNKLNDFLGRRTFWILFLFCLKTKCGVLPWTVHSGGEVGRTQSTLGIHIVQGILSQQGFCL